MKPPRKAPSNWLGRVLTGFALGLGLGALVLSFVPATTRSAATSIVPTQDAPDLTQPASPAHAAAASRSGSASQTVSAADPLLNPTPRPIVRQGVPTEARPAVNARSIGSGQASGPSAPVPPAPFSVVVVLEDQPALGRLGQAVVDGLNQAGILARIATLKDAGRPDAILLANDVSGGRNEAWFCDPGPQQSSTLALTLLSAVGPGSAAPSADSPRSEFKPSGSAPLVYATPTRTLRTGLSSMNERSGSTPTRAANVGPRRGSSWPGSTNCGSFNFPLSPSVLKRPAS